MASPDIGFIPTPQDALGVMLALAVLTPNDVVYDLGSGDGRLLIQAAQRYGVQGVGIDIDPVRVAEGRSLAEKAGVGDRVSFRAGNLYAEPFEAATVVFVYLLPHLNLRLRPKLRQLRPGSRVVSHQFDMGDWQPERVVKLPESEEESTVYLWVV
ncbi:MAG: methyltransferase domain-containing protein [Cyanobacteria bacterium P01_A01_bin.135]